MYRNGQTRNNSKTNTTRQQMTETGNRLRPAHADTMPTTKATAPAIGEDVASSIAGNVITAKVTYGT